MNSISEVDEQLNKERKPSLVFPSPSICNLSPLKVRYSVLSFTPNVSQRQSLQEEAHGLLALLLSG